MNVYREREKRERREERGERRERRERVREERERGEREERVQKEEREKEEREEREKLVRIHDWAKQEGWRAVQNRGNKCGPFSPPPFPTKQAKPTPSVTVGCLCARRDASVPRLQ